jgi:hypothetical protein
MGASYDKTNGERRVECNQHPCIQSCYYLLSEEICASFLHLHNDFKLPNVVMENNYENNKNIVENAF